MTVMVLDFSVQVNNSANRNSPQLIMKEKMPAAAKPGTATGKNI